MTARRTAAFLVCIGIAAQTAQILLLRELMALSYGTEAAAALLLGVWMGGAAAGSAGAKRGTPLLFSSILAAAVPCAVVLVRIGRTLLGAGAGEAVSLTGLFIITLATAFPVAALSGALFVSAAKQSSDPGRAYAWEAAGAGLAGILLCVFLLQWAPALSLAFGSAALALLFPLRTKIQIPLAAAAVALLVFLPAIDDAARALYWNSFSRGEFRIVETRNSPYGPLAAIDYEGQVSIYQSGRLLFSLPDRGEAAAPVHLALLKHKAPHRVLLVGGGIAGALRAALLHPVVKVDYVELDPDVVSIAKSHAADSMIDDARVTFHAADGRSFVRSSPDGLYDAVIVLGAGPATLAGNRYYTAEFFAEVRRALADEGVFVVGPLVSHGAYAAGRSLPRNGMILRTLLQEFPDAKATGGGALYLAAGGDGLVEQRAAKREIEDAGLHFLIDPPSVEKVNAELLTGRPFDPLSDDIALEPAAGPVNRDARPLAVFESTALDVNLVRDPIAPLMSGLGWALGAAGVLLLLALLGVRILRPASAPGISVFVIGLFGSGSVLLVLAAYQSSFGALYLGAAAVLGLFMAGMAAGAAAGRRLPLELSLASAAIVSGLCALAFLADFLPLHLAAALLAGACVGAAFPAALRRVGEGKVGPLYALDLAGGMAGALVLAPLALPLWGAGPTAAVLAAACLLALETAWATR